MVVSQKSRIAKSPECGSFPFAQAQGLETRLSWKPEGILTSIPPIFVTSRGDLDDRWSQWTAWDGWPGSLHLGSLMVTDGWWMLLDVTVFNPNRWTDFSFLIFLLTQMFWTFFGLVFFWCFWMFPVEIMLEIHGVG